MESLAFIWKQSLNTSRKLKLSKIMGAPAYSIWKLQHKN